MTSTSPEVETGMTLALQLAPVDKLRVMEMLSSSLQTEIAPHLAIIPC